MVFKRTPKPRDDKDDFAQRALRKVQEQDADMTAAEAAFEEGRRLEGEEDDEGALQAHQESAMAWERRFIATGHRVSHLPYERIAIILRRHGQPHAEAEVLERYVAHAGRDPHPKLLARLERARELAEELELADEEEDS